MEELSWSPSLRGGGAGEPVTFAVDRDTADVLRDLWGQIERCPPGAKRSTLVCELRTLLDLCACFPGGTLSAALSAAEPDVTPPPYLDLEGAENGSESVEEDVSVQLGFGFNESVGRKDVDIFGAPVLTPALGHRGRP